MRPLRALLFALLLACFTVGASCDDSPEEASPSASSEGASASADAPKARIESLGPVDTSKLSDADRERWVGLVNEVLSPCGQPISVARCVKEGRGCNRCVPAARYLVRLVEEGYERGQIEEYYQHRYGPDSKVDLSLDDSPVRGSPMAPVTIVEFSDFECPFCGAAYPILEQLVEQSDGKVRLVFKHYPLDQHTHARLAAKAAIAAKKQNKFWEMHDLLFENQHRLQKPDLVRYARQLGLDVERFKKDLESEEVEKALAADKAEGREVGVQGTPTIFVNGRRFEEPLRALPSYVGEALDR
jgi:protein-disulfide isomerase